MKKFPLYYEHGECFFKILGTYDFIEVNESDDEFGIAFKKNRGIVSLAMEQGREIDKEAYEKSYEFVLEFLNKLTNLPSIEAVTNQR